ncbi:uncharacterized protein BP5553_03186 [Venustampulla echinocandica]|uniref:Uncharacterized protein n=1 Tax=Venustampulla echinocandica TaxID=2656787 RepID=A0A370TTI5_9HELO|nr:uncharacterized protein BP5553_03186 [Venustampulla echinocandica]RDL38846.1 hypothetical protein BP5553_03186 [Venustampulla echinocandica]
MGSTESELVRKAEALLAAARNLQEHPNERHALLRQVELFRQELEDPMDAMIRQWTS